MRLTKNKNEKQPFLALNFTLAEQLNLNNNNFGWLEAFSDLCLVFRLCLFVEILNRCTCMGEQHSVDGFSSMYVGW